MTDWTIELLRPAEKYVRRLPRPDRERVLRALFALQDDPANGDVMPMEGSPGLWRLRVGDYRALLRVEREEGRIIVTRIGPRGDVDKTRGGH